MDQKILNEIKIIEITKMLRFFTLSNLAVVLGAFLPLIVTMTFALFTYVLRLGI